MKPLSRISVSASPNVTRRTRVRSRYGTPRFVACAMRPPATDPPSIATPSTISPLARTVSSFPPLSKYPLNVSASTSQASNGAREEREAEAQERRGERPGPEGRRGVPHQQIERRGRGERDRAEQVGGPPATRVGDDSGGHLEDHHAGGEEGVGGERLCVAQAGVEQEERVDAPDERGRERMEEEQQQVDALNPGGGGPVGFLSWCGHRVFDSAAGLSRCKHGAAGREARRLGQPRRSSGAKTEPGNVRRRSLHSRTGPAKPGRMRRPPAGLASCRAWARIFGSARVWREETQ